MVENRVDSCLNLSQSFKVQNKHQNKFKKWSGGNILFVNAVYRQFYRFKSMFRHIMF